MKKNRKKGKILRIVFVLVILLIVGAVGLYANFVNIYNKNINNLGLSSTKDVNVTKNPVAVLLLGEGTNIDDEQTGVDSICVLLINPNKKIVRIIGIPRDSYLPTINKYGQLGPYDKITHSGNDVAQLKNIVEHLLKIEINYFVSVNFIDFIKIIDSLGGIEMNVPDLREQFMEWEGNYEDGTYIPEDSPLKNGKCWCEHDSHRNPYAVCFDKFGMQLLDGEHALALARSRHYDSDFARNVRQMEMIKAMALKFTKSLNITNINQLLDIVTNNVRTNVPSNKFLNFILLAKMIFSSSDSYIIQTYQLDGESDTFEGEVSGFASYNKVSIYSIDLLRSKCKEIFDENFFLFDTEPFFFDINKSEYSSAYKDYRDLGFLEDSMDIDEDF